MKSRTGEQIISEMFDRINANPSPAATLASRLRTIKTFFSVSILFPALLLCLVFDQAVSAKIGVVLMDSVPGTAGYLAQGGHAALYLSETCTDDFLSLRACTPADPEWGVVAERTATFSEKAEFDWLALPASLSLNAVQNSRHAPLIINKRIRRKLIENFYFHNPRLRKLVVGNDPEFEKGMRLSKGTRIPIGRWQNLLGSQLRRSIHVVWITDQSGSQERDLVNVINRLPNRPRYNLFLFLFAGNCSKWVKNSLSQIDELKESGFGHNITGDAFMISPKGITEESFNAGKKLMAKNSRIHVTVELFPQVPGTFTKSQNPLFVFENAFDNNLMWPVLVYFHPITFLIGKLYYTFVKRFSINDKYASYFNYEAAELSVRDDSPKAVRRNRMKSLRAEFFGTSGWWRDKKIAFKQLLINAEDAGMISSARDVQKGRLLKQLLDGREEIEFDQNGAPWLLRPGRGGRTMKTGLTFDTVSKGSLRLGFEIMAARIQYQLKKKHLERRIPREEFEPEWNKLFEIGRALRKEELAGKGN